MTNVANLRWLQLFKMHRVPLCSLACHQFYPTFLLLLCSLWKYWQSLAAFTSAVVNVKVFFKILYKLCTYRLHSKIVFTLSIRERRMLSHRSVSSNPVKITAWLSFKPKCKNLFSTGVFVLMNFESKINIFSKVWNKFRKNKWGKKQPCSCSRTLCPGITLYLLEI